jgi:hypothetical protein
VSLVKKCFEETTPEEVGSNYIRNAGNTPPLKSKIDVIIYATVSHMSFTSFVTKFTTKEISIEKKKWLGKSRDKGKQEQDPICEQICCCEHSRGRAGMRMEVSCFAQTRRG